MKKEYNKAGLWYKQTSQKQILRRRKRLCALGLDVRYFAQHSLTRA